MIAMGNVLLALVLVPVVLQPGAGRSQAREDQDCEPDVVGVFFEERSLVAVDIGGRSRMRRQRGVLVGIGLFDLRSGRQFARELLAVGEELAGGGWDRGGRQRRGRGGTGSGG